MTSRAAIAVRTTMERATRSTLSSIAEYTPLLGRAARRRRQRIVLAPYTRVHTVRGPILKTIAVAVLLLACIVYGFFFALWAPYIMVPFVAPILAVFAMVIWALPETRSPPTFPLEVLFPLFFIILILWPNYVAVSLPGLPWITLQRIVSYPMAFILLINLSTSHKFRKLMWESVSSIKPMWYFLSFLMFVDLYTISFSESPIVSTQIVLNQFVTWLCIFAVSATIFRNESLITRYFGLLCALGVAITLLVLFEDKRQYIPWAAHIPNFLRIEAPSVHNTLTPSFRAYTNIYRSKATFSTPLGLSEFLSLLTPLFLYFFFYSNRWWIRIGCISMIPMLFIAIRMTDARLGVVGMLISVLVYGSLWSIVRWRSRPRDLLAAAIVYGYPAVFAGGIAAVLASARLNAMVFGGGAQVSSTNARKDQLAMAMASMWKAPWGHGPGQSGAAMGFAEGQSITIDNYFISLALDYGVIGIFLWYSIFLTAIFYALRYCLSPVYGKTREAQLLAPLVVTLIAFLVIKWVHGQDDNHPIYFMMLGMISALVLGLRKQREHADSKVATRPDYP